MGALGEGGSGGERDCRWQLVLDVVHPPQFRRHKVVFSQSLLDGTAYERSIASAAARSKSVDTFASYRLHSGSATALD